MNPLLFTWLFAIAASPEVVSFELSAPIDDVLSAEDQIWLLTRENGSQPRAIYQMAADGVPKMAAPPPAQAIGADICRDAAGKWTPIYVGADGILSAAGDVLMPGRFLFSVVDRTGLMGIPTCNASGDTWLLFTQNGLRIRHDNGIVQDVDLPPDVRGYSGRTQEGMRGEPTFGAALSLYLPRFSFQENHKSAKSQTRLVVQKQSSIHLFEKKDSVLFAQTALPLDFQRDLHIPKEMSPHPIWVDLNADGTEELVVSLTEGFSTETTRIWWWSVSTQKGLSEAQVLLERDGFWLPLGAVKRPSGDGLLLAEVSLGLTEVASALLTGEIPLRTWLVPGDGAQPVHTHTFHPQIQLRGERRIGSRPIATLDLDGDGWTDLIDLRDDRNVVWYRGQRNGFARTPSAPLTVPSFTRHIVLPHSNSLVLLNDAKSGGSVGTWIWGGRKHKNKSASGEGGRLEQTSKTRENAVPTRR